MLLCVCDMIMSMDAKRRCPEALEFYDYDSGNGFTWALKLSNGPFWTCFSDWLVPSQDASNTASRQLENLRYNIWVNGRFPEPFQGSL